MLNKHSILLAFFLICSVEVFCNDAFMEKKHVADSLYMQEYYEEAASLYEDLIKQAPQSSLLYYNLGNCYYRLDSIPQCILSYERASLFDPGDSDVNLNLAFARAKIKDKIPTISELFFVTWWRQFTSLTNISIWILLGFLSFMFLLIIYLFYERRYKIALMSIFFGVSLIANLAAFTHYMVQHNRDFAIIMVTQTNINSSPSVDATCLFVLHGGVKVQISDDSLLDWCEVKLADGRQGWIEKNKLEII